MKRFDTVLVLSLLVILLQSCSGGSSPTTTLPGSPSEAPVQTSSDGRFTLDTPIAMAPAGSLRLDVIADGSLPPEAVIDGVTFTALPVTISPETVSYVATPESALDQITEATAVYLPEVKTATIQLISTLDGSDAVSLIYQTNLSAVTFNDYVLIRALSSLPINLRTPENIAEQANTLLSNEVFTAEQFNPVPAADNTDFVIPGSFPAPDLLDAAAVYAASFLPAELRTAANLAISINTLLPSAEVEPSDLRAIPGVELPGPAGNVVGRRFIPVGAGYEMDTLELFAREAIAYNTDNVVEIRVLLAPFSFDSEVPIDPELNLEDGQFRADQVQAACEALVSSPVTCNTTLPDVQLRVDAQDPDIVAQYDPEVVDGIYGLGGDQEIAMQIVANTPLEAAMQESYRRGAPFAGNSAGAAVQSRNMFLAFADDGVIPITLITAFTPQGLELDSFQLFYEPDNSVRRGLLYGITQAVVEQHTHQRGRLIRLMQAAQRSPGPKVGVGVDAFTGSLILDETKVVETIGDTSTVILDQETYNSAATSDYIGPRQVLSIHNVAMHLLPEGGYGYDLETRLPTFNSVESSGAPSLAGRSFDFLVAPAGAGPLFLGGDQRIPDNPDFLEPIADPQRLGLQPFVDQAMAAAGETVILSIGYDDSDPEGDEVLTEFNTTFTDLGLTAIQTVRLTDATDLDSLAQQLAQADAIFITGDDQSIVAQQIPALETLDIQGLWQGGRILYLDNAAAAAAGARMVADPTPTTAYESSSSRRQAEVESLATYITGGVSFADGLNLISGAAFEPRAFFDYKYGRLLSHIFDEDPTVVAIGIERETALAITQAGTTVAGPDGVIVFDGRRSTVLDIGSNGSFAANWFIVDTFATGETVTPN